MTIKILGKKSFSSKSNVEKVNYMFNIGFTKDSVDGMEVSSVFVPLETYNKYKVGDSINDVAINYASHTIYRNI